MTYRPTIDLTGTGPWRFQPDPFEEGQYLGYHRPEHDVSRWREVTLPNAFDRLMPVLASYEGLAWHRRSVRVPREWAGRRVVVRFEGANVRTRVWVNGQPCGTNEDPFLPFELPAHDALRFGEDNVIVAAVDNIRRPGDVPGMQRGWRPYGGILREVSLVASGWCHVRAVRVDARPATNGGGVATVHATCRNDGAAPAEVSVRLQVAGRSLTSAPVTLEPESEQLVPVELTAEGVRPWSPDDPVLYDATVSLLDAGEIVDERAIRIGFRTIEARNDGKLSLNGRKIFLTGFNRHEDSAGRDHAVDLATARRDFAHMKRLGCNYVRLCHYPHHPGELDLCDEIGLMVMCEIPLYWWGGNYGRDKAIDETGKLDVAKRQLTRMIERDAHHPSVILWSVSNETFEEHAEVVEGNATLVRLAKQLDPSRLATHVSDKWAKSSHFEADDVCSVNAYPSWGARGVNKRPDYDLADSREWWARNLAKLRAAYPGKPILVAEFGNPAFEGVTGNFIGEDAQAAVIESEFGAMTPDVVCGATVWCYADHPWPEEDFVRQITTSPFGVVTRERKPKLACEVVGRLFRERQAKG